MPGKDTRQVPVTLSIHNRTQLPICIIWVISFMHPCRRRKIELHTILSTRCDCITTDTEQTASFADNTWQLQPRRQTHSDSHTSRCVQHESICTWRQTCECWILVTVAGEIAQACPLERDTRIIYDNEAIDSRRRQKRTRQRVKKWASNPKGPTMKHMTAEWATGRFSRIASM